MKVTCMLLACLSFLPAGCRDRSARTHGATPPRGDLELGALLESVRQETHVPGIAAAVVSLGGVTATAAAGLRRVDDDAPLDTSDRFRLGSNTKAMTAFVVARFVERGQLSWETTLAEAFPEWSASMDPAYRAIPIRDLLRHRAGIAAMMKDDEWLYRGIFFWQALQSLPTQRRIVARNALHHPPAVPPGTYLYSNAGYVIAGALLEKVSGKPWEEVIRGELFVPLRMESCGFGQPVRGSARGQPFGHVLHGEQYEPDDGDVPALFGPSGMVTCTLADWASFVRANMRDPPRPVVSPGTLALLHQALPTGRFPDGSPASDDRLGYAMGWGTWDSPSDPYLWHTGSNDRNFALVRILQRRGLAFLVAVNAGGDGAERAAERALDLMLARTRQVDEPSTQP